jgi:hypothetical protein
MANNTPAPDALLTECLENDQRPTTATVEHQLRYLCDELATDGIEDDMGADVCKLLRQGVCEWNALQADAKARVVATWLSAH